MFLVQYLYLYCFVCIVRVVDPCHVAQFESYQVVSHCFRWINIIQLESTHPHPHINNLDPWSSSGIFRFPLRIHLRSLVFQLIPLPRIILQQLRSQPLFIDRSIYNTLRHYRLRILSDILPSITERFAGLM